MNLPTPSFIEPHRARFGELDLDESDKVPKQKRVINDGEIFFRSNGTSPLAKKIPTHLSSSPGKIQRPHVGGKFLFIGNEKFWVRGVTYGAFRPGPNGQEYHDPMVLEETFL